jgi:hypothetical protein
MVGGAGARSPIDERFELKPEPGPEPMMRWCSLHSDSSKLIGLGGEKPRKLLQGIFV